MNNNFDYNYTNNNTGTNNKYLNEENYQKGKKKITIIAVIVLVIGLTIGGGLIATGIIRHNSKFLEEKIEVEKKKLETKKVELEAKQLELENERKTELENEKKKLEEKKAELQNKGIKKSSNYEDGEAYDLYIITDVLDPGFSYCSFSKYNMNVLTSKYCSLTTLVPISDELAAVRMVLSEPSRCGWSEYQDNVTTSEYCKLVDRNEPIKGAPYYAFGGFIIIATLMISGNIFVIAKRREITAFTIQQTMPVHQEAIEEMTPTVANAAGSIGKELAKGIASGINETNQNNENK